MSSTTKLIQWDSSLPKLLETAEREMILSFMEERFAIMPDCFDDFWVIAFSRQAFLMRKQKNMAGLQPYFPRDHFIRAGLPFVRNVAGYLKPTTVFVQRFGNEASRNCVALALNELKTLSSQGRLVIEGQRASGLSEGYVIVRYGGFSIGVSLFIEGSTFLCRFPKALRQTLASI